MSSDEDDYMSDKFTSSVAKADIRPGLQFSQKRKREIDLIAKKAKIDDEERQKHRPTTVRQQERLQEGLKEAIPSTNIGFALLKKMGFKEGEAIGKTNQGIKNPIEFTVKNDRFGLGREAAIKQVKERQFAIMKERHEQQIKEAMDPEEFRRRMVRNSELKQVEGDLARCQRACERLDREAEYENPILVWFWPIKEEERAEDAESDSDGDKPPVEEEDLEEYEPHEKLAMVNNYLKTTHLFCSFCGVKYEDAEDLMENCPGDTKADH